MVMITRISLRSMVTGSWSMVATPEVLEGADRDVLEAGPGDLAREIK